MPEIIRVLKESLPKVQLVGICYGDEDRDENGSYAPKWGEWMEKQRGTPLLRLKGIEGVSEDMVGAMRHHNGKFEYWIGFLMAPGDTPPEGYDAVQLPERLLGVCYLYGPNDGTLYGMEAHEACMAKFKEQNWKVDENAWFFERYNRERFDKPDEKGHVILDYCATLL